MPTKSKLLTVLIVIFTLALVFGPVFLPREISRWYLAAAHNAFRIKDTVLAEHYLQKAEAWDPNIKQDGDYWIAQLPSNGAQNADQLLDLIERAVMTDSRWKLRARQAADILSENYDFVHAVRALKIAALNQRPSSADELNQLAYMRSLAVIELDEALKDIDLAIELGGPSPSYLDTKAWVLHGMKRNLEALAEMKNAIEGMEKMFAKSRVPLPQPLEAEVSKDDVSKDGAASHSAANANDSAAASEQELENLMFLNGFDKTSPPTTTKQRQLEIYEAKKRIGDAGFALGVMRFHRMRILEALSKNVEANGATGAREAAERAAEDRRWLVERGIPPVDELF